MWRFLSVCWIGASLGAAFAQSNRDLYLEFLHPIIEAEIGTAGDVWAYSGSGGYLFRFSLESDDGSKTLFLASSLRANNLSATWNVYRESAAGGLSYVEKMRLPMTELKIERTPQGISFWTWSSDQGQYHISKQELIDGNVITESYEMPYAQFVDSEEEKLKKRLTSFIPQIEAIRLADFLRDPSASWAKLDVMELKSNEMGYVVIPELPLSKADLQLTPEAALQEVEQLTAAQDPQSTPRPAERESIPPPIPSPKLQSSPAPTAAAESPAPSPSFPIVPAAIIAAVIVGVIVFLLRRK